MSFVILLASLLPFAAAPQIAELPVVAPVLIRTDACSGPAREAFDFWLGEWEVQTPGGQKAGTNIITLEEGGCLIVERWTGADGNTGQSYNFLDPATRLWRQVWVSPGAVIDYSGGPLPDGGMRLEGAIRYQGSGAVFPFRGTWSVNADGTVRQHFEQADPETGVWSDWFTGIYIRRSQPDAEKG